MKLPTTAQNQLGTSLPDEDVWTAEEQKIFEEGVRKYPASDAERWEKVHTCFVVYFIIFSCFRYRRT